LEKHLMVLRHTSHVQKVRHLEDVHGKWSACTYPTSSRWVASQDQVLPIAKPQNGGLGDLLHEKKVGPWGLLQQK
jgi:hypothetical protein